MAAMEMNHAEFTQAMQEGKLLLVDYWAPWCSYCRRIAPAYEAIAQSYRDRCLVAKVDIDREPALADRENIEVIPTLVLYRDGRAVDSLVAPESRALIENMLKKHLP